MESGYSKGSCLTCGGPLEFLTQAAGRVVDCPHCSEKTELVPQTDAESQAEASHSEESPIFAFSGGTIKPRLSLGYHLAMLPVAAFMVVLPILYLCFIGCLAYLVYWHATVHYEWFDSNTAGIRFLFVKSVVYGGLILAGVITIVFMFKPVFARPYKRNQSLALNPGTEQIVYSFVSQVAQAVRAPMPARIDLDCSMNASAGFRKGFGSFMGNDLVLSIGLPLVGALNTRELAGVIAHEFGHFRQGFAMRISYIIRSINGWFSRVIYERDEWDLWLAKNAEESEGWYIGLPLYFAQVGVWISRLVLKTLMFTGHLVSSSLLRQMEYDADYYEIKVAGSDAFERSTKKIYLWSAAINHSYGLMQRERQLPSNFSRFAQSLVESLTEEERLEIESDVFNGISAWYDSHPTDKDRIQAAKRMAEPGIYQFEAPAESLFSNYDVVAEQVSMLHYREDLGIRIPGF